MKTSPSTFVAVFYAATLLFDAAASFVLSYTINTGLLPLPGRSKPVASRASGTAGTRDRRQRQLDSELSATKISSEEVRIRNIEQLNKLRIRDRQSLKIDSEELQRRIVHEDRWIVCVNKPAGVLCVPSEEGIPTLAQAVFENVQNQQSSLDRMVVHRLGMDTSGLVLFAKDMESLREMNTLFRTRKIVRKYEALVCGHVTDDKGTIDLPLMRDYEKPPFMRISTEEHQKVLDELDDKIVGKKLLESPKDTKTIYEVVSRETFQDTDLPVTRLLLTSVTGRTHQLNVHMAAIGHPIVGDRFYGWNGDAVANGGLEHSSNTEIAAGTDLQEAIGKVATSMCVHAKSLSFLHPMRPWEEKPQVFECKAPF